MKKIALIVAFLMLVPCAAFGMQMLNNSSMDKITGQSGVSIDFDDVQVFMHIDTIAYIDSDGVSALVAPSTNTNFGTEGGAIALNDFTLNLLNVNAVVGEGTANTTNGFASTAAQLGPNMKLASAGLIPLFYDYATGAAVTGSYLNSIGNGSVGLSSTTYIDPVTGTTNGIFVPRFLTIDVTNNLPVATAAIQYLQGTAIGAAQSIPAGVTMGGVVIGIPTMEVYISSMSLTPYYTGAINGLTTSAYNEDANFGTIQFKGITMTTLSGWVEIAPH